MSGWILCRKRGLAELLSPPKKGYYVSKDDRTEEIPCDEGRYSPGSGARECFKCSPGTYTNAKAQSECKKAEAGWYVACADDFMAPSCYQLSLRRSSCHRHDVRSMAWLSPRDAFVVRNWFSDSLVEFPTGTSAARA